MSLRVTTIVNGKWRENCYILSNPEGDAIIVDPGSQEADIAAPIEENGWKVYGILNTHAHYDHIGAVAPLMERYQAPFYLHGADEQLLKRANLYRMLFESRDAVRVPAITHNIAGFPSSFRVGPFDIDWIATPGHTGGSICLLCGEFLFSGDTLMRNHVGRTDLPGANRAQLQESVRKLMTLPGETIVYGGHGPVTTLAAEFEPGSAVWNFLQ